MDETLNTFNFDEDFDTEGFEDETSDFDTDFDEDFEEAESDFDDDFEEAESDFEEGFEEAESDFEEGFEEAESNFDEFENEAIGFGDYEGDFEEAESDFDAEAFEDETSSFDAEDTTSLNLDESEPVESEEEEKSSRVKMNDAAKKAYNETFNGEEQLEHSLFDISSKLKLTTETIPLKFLIPSNFKKVSRAQTIIGLNGIVSQWGVINPVHVMKLEEEDAYLILDGLRRVYAAMKNGLEEIECRVWDFDDKVAGKKLANVISLMINRSEKYRPNEQWNMMQILEDVNDLTPGLLEYLLQLESGQSLKLKDIMCCEIEYAEIRDKLFEGELDIEGAYKRLCAARKKENRLAKEDNTAIENPIDDNAGAPDDKRRLSDDEVHDLLELTNTDVSGENVAEMDMTNEIRGNDKYQTTDERHPVDQAIRQGTFMRDDFHCRCCGTGGVQWLGVLVFHHAVPVYAGGPDTIENGLTLCQNCHMTLHNYIQGKVQVDLESLSESQQTVFKNIFKYGNIAVKAVKMKGIKRDELSKLDKTGTQHAYPDANIKENMQMYKNAQSENEENEGNKEDE